jgi:hypothetical protein
MTDDDKTLDEIAEEIGVIVEKQKTDGDEESTAREGDGKPEDMDKRNMDDYDGGW